MQVTSQHEKEATQKRKNRMAEFSVLTRMEVKYLVQWQFCPLGRCAICMSDSVFGTTQVRILKESAPIRGRSSTENTPNGLHQIR